MGVPQRARTQCQTARAKELAKKRVFYKMSGPQNIYPFPHLDHPAKTAIGYFLKEKFHAKWSYLYYKVLMKSREKASNATKMKYGKSFFTSYENYTKLEKYFRDTLMVSNNHDHITSLFVCFKSRREIFVLVSKVANAAVIGRRMTSKRVKVKPL